MSALYPRMPSGRGTSGVVGKLRESTGAANTDRRQTRPHRSLSCPELGANELSSELFSVMYRW